jgi:hypothetical protein
MDPVINLTGYDDVSDAQRLLSRDRGGVELIAYNLARRL